MNASPARLAPPGADSFGAANLDRPPARVRRLAMLAVALVIAATPVRGQSTLELRLAGRDVAVDVYAPAGPVRGAAILSHGFTRSRTTLADHARALADVGVLALTPDLPTTFDFRRNAQGLAELVARLRAGGPFGAPVERVVLIGFSAGALSSLLAAATPGVVGYVGLDPFDRVDGNSALGLGFAPTLRTEAILLRAPPSRCNANGVAAPWGAALPALVSERVIDGASHCDFEAPSDWLCRLACGATDAARQAVVRATLLQAVERWMPRNARPGSSRSPAVGALSAALRRHASSPRAAAAATAGSRSAAAPAAGS